MIELFRELGMHPHDSNITQKYSTRDLLPLGGAFQYNHKSTETGCSILCSRAFFSGEGLQSFLHILKENHKP